MGRNEVRIQGGGEDCSAEQAKQVLDIVRKVTECTRDIPIRDFGFCGKLRPQGFSGCPQRPQRRPRKQFKSREFSDFDVYNVEETCRPRCRGKRC